VFAVEDIAEQFEDVFDQEQQPKSQSVAALFLVGKNEGAIL
jgi:hypothetical protein